MMTNKKHDGSEGPHGKAAAEKIYWKDFVLTDEIAEKVRQYEPDGEMCNILTALEEAAGIFLFHRGDYDDMNAKARNLLDRIYGKGNW
jgi:hypothetical protein